MSEVPHVISPSSSARFNQVIARMKRWLLLSDVELLRVVFATIVANRMPGDPVWLFIIAPSGGVGERLDAAVFGAASMKIICSPSDTPAGLGPRTGLFS